MKLPLLFAMLALLAVDAAHAQNAPFDMAPDRPAVQTPSNPPPSQPGSGDSAPEAGARPVPAAPFRRYIVPSPAMALNGELDGRTWSIYLTPDQAAANAKLNLGYQNAIFVAPEMSQLTVEINGTVISSRPIQSTDAVSEFSVVVPPQLLKPGANTIGFRVKQRHRTDCSVDSTYQLWSNIDPAQTYVTFDQPLAAGLKTLDDIKAVGVDQAGSTAFEIVAPAFEQPAATVPLMRLAQSLAVIANMPNQSFAVAATGAPTQTAGRMTIYVGTAAELQPLFPSLPAGAASAPVATFVNDPKTGAAALVVSGPTWQAIGVAIETIASPLETSTRRTALATLPWRSPDAPMLFSDTRIAFSQFGIRTEEFSGRRLRTDFTVGIPSDFYADAYGTAVILLDAAYSDAVLPGSHIDVYVNDSIAATVPITSSGGGILRHLPINVTMRHFRPGLNVLTLEAVLNTQEDSVCAPGATADDTPRFALFDTSEFRMPSFARIGQLPNLAAVSGTGFPYNRPDAKTPLFIDRLDADTLSATATLLGRLATAAGHPLGLETIASPSLAGDRDAILIGSLSQMPKPIFTQMHIDENSRATWGTAEAGTAPAAQTEATFDAWRSKVSDGLFSAQIVALEAWMKRNFDISFNSLRFAPAGDQSFTPPADAGLMIAQGESPSEDGIWTLATAPDGKALRDGMQAMSTQANWGAMSGHISTYSQATKTVNAVPVATFDFVPTQPPSIANYRLIAANWLSTNILSYAVLLVALSIILGIATAAFLGNLGRRP